MRARLIIRAHVKRVNPCSIVLGGFFFSAVFADLPQSVRRLVARGLRSERAGSADGNQRGRSRRDRRQRIFRGQGTCTRGELASLSGDRFGRCALSSRMFCRSSTRASRTGSSTSCGRRSKRRRGWRTRCRNGKSLSNRRLPFSNDPNQSHATCLGRQLSSNCQFNGLAYAPARSRRRRRRRIVFEYDDAFSRLARTIIKFRTVNPQMFYLFV